MVMEYNKKGRTSGSSPRDLQNRANTTNQPTNIDSVVISELLDKVIALNTEIESLKREGVKTSPAVVVSSGKVYTEEEFNVELTSAILKELENSNESKKNKELEDSVSKLGAALNKYEALIHSLKEKLKNKDLRIEGFELKVEALKLKIEAKDSIINDISSTANSVSTTKVIPTERPSIEESIIDPTEKTNIESHINIKEVVDITHKEKDTMKSKLNKLQELLGG